MLFNFGLHYNLIIKILSLACNSGSADESDVQSWFYSQSDFRSFFYVNPVKNVTSICTLYVRQNVTEGFDPRT